jgi:hypothetical protein
MTIRHRLKTGMLGLLWGGGVLLGTGCLPENFFSDLAGTSVSSITDALLGALIAAIIGAAAT